MLINNLNEEVIKEFLELLGEEASKGTVLYGGTMELVDKEGREIEAPYFAQHDEREMKFYELLYIDGKLEAKFELDEKNDSKRYYDITSTMLEYLREYGVYE